MRLRERDEPLDPQVERELEAVDGALAGRPVDPGLQDLADLTALIAEERPEPAPEWSAELDQRVATRFRGEGSSSRLRTWLGGLRPMQIAAPIGALATAAVIVVVGVSSTGDDSANLQPISGGSIDQTIPEPTVSSDSTAESAVPLEDEGLDAATSGGYAVPKEEIAPGTEKRQIERNVSLALSTRPENVREVSDEAIGIVRSLNGIVASSQVSEAGSQASASLQLTIPTRNLDTALDRLTDLANVKSMDETTEDITKPFVSAQDRLRDAEAERRSLLQALANADTDAEADALRLQVADARDAISDAQAEFENIARRARLSDISLTIVGDPTVDEDRSIGDWFDDAVSVLRDVAGVLLISAAILVPLGILVALGWLVVSRARRRRRERALD